MRTLINLGSVLAVVFLLAATDAHGAIVTVTNLNDSGAGSFRQAAADAGAGDEIQFAVTGTITLTSGEISVYGNITITGPGPTVLTVDGNDTSRVLAINASATAAISGMTIQNGRAPDGVTDGQLGESGGGIRATGSLTLTDCVVRDCVAGNGADSTSTVGGRGGDGGGVQAYYSLTMIRCTVTGCFSGNGGNSSVSQGGMGGQGGGIYVHPANPHTFTDCIIDGNTAGDGGTGAPTHGSGGIGGGVTFGGSVTFTRCTISNNQARNIAAPGYGAGGGISSSINSGTVIFEDCTISGNDARRSGGIDFYQTSATFTGCSLTGNTCGTAGAGIFASAGSAVTLSFTNCTFSGNVGGGSGAALQVYEAPVTVDLINCTITNNTSTGEWAGGIITGSATVNITNTIIAGNMDALGEPDVRGPVVSGGGNLIGDTTGATITGDLTGNRTGVDPMLGALADNGGPTMTHAPSASSPGIDAGVVAGAPTEDQRGVPRDASPDMGATEYARATVTTDDATLITTNSARSGGNVTWGGDSAVTGYGVCWNASGSPTTADDSTAIGAGAGSFVSDLTGLTPDTEYYVRAYATNDAGTSYGPERTFTSATALPAVTTAAISAITATSASCGGEVTDEGTSAVSDRGACWNTTGSPTTADDSTAIGAGAGAFATTIASLTPLTTYYVRAYATSSSGTSYGSEETFTTTGLPPTVVTAPILQVTWTAFACDADVTDAGSSAVTLRGICWDTAPGPTDADQILGAGSGTGSFSLIVVTVTPSTTYYVRAFATNSYGTSYSTEQVIDIPAEPPTITTASVANITQTSADCGGEVVSEGSNAVTTRGVAWNTSGLPTLADDTTSDGTGAGAFTSALTGLTPNTTYYVRAYASTSTQTMLGTEVQFATLATPSDDDGGCLPGASTSAGTLLLLAAAVASLLLARQVRGRSQITT